MFLLPPEELIQDSIYNSFVLPGYSEVKQQLKEAQAEIARLKALLAN